MTTDRTTDQNKTPATGPVVLCILDGWGHRVERENNAFALADTPHLDNLFASCPHALLETSGLHVGLPDGQMGNSEVGHMNIGGGRVVAQDLPRIDAAIASGALAQSPDMADFIAKAKTGSNTCHLMGLLSPGGVHSHQDHIVALARILNNAGIRVVVHAFMDGRDTPPTSGADCGKCMNWINTARPRMPKTMEGTAARFEMLTSIRSVKRFCGANSSR